MNESQLQAGNNLQTDRNTVYDQMKDMKSYINQCSRKSFKTEDCKEQFDTFKQNLLEQCDKWVEDQRKLIDKKFAKL